MRAQRQNQEQERLQKEAQDSYLKLDQYEYITDRILNAKKRLSQQQGIIDLLEKKMLDVINKRHEKEQERRERLANKVDSQLNVGMLALSEK